MLDSLEIEKELTSLGFKQNPGPQKRIHEFSRDDTVIYVKTPGQNQTSERVKKRPLVVPPEYKKPLRQLLPLAGIDPDFKEFYHNTGMRKFSKGKSPRGAKDNHRGLAVGVRDADALEDFLSIIACLGVGGELSAAISERNGAHGLPNDETERRAVIAARIGQGKFRKDLIRYWKACALTGIKEPLLLRASHIRPWRESNNRERLDPYNGLLLAAHLDLAFDSGLISFSDSGVLLKSKVFRDAAAIGISSNMSLAKVEAAHRRYLAWHRKHIFKG